VVLLADLASGIRGGNSFVVHRERGEFAFYLKSKDAPYRTANWPGEEYEENRGDAEQARLLYVAMTRARDRLYLMTHWAKSARGKAFQRFLPVAFDESGPAWDEDLPCGVVLDTSRLDVGGTEAAIERVDVPEGELSAQARERLAARAAWRAELDTLLDTTEDALRWRTPSRLGHGFVPSEAAGSDVGRRVGSAVHDALDRACLMTDEELDAAARAAAREQGLVGEAAETVRHLVGVAARSDLLRRARAGGGQHEVPFAVSVEDVILSGSIDLLFVEDGGLVLVDFKTDAGTDMAALAEAYRPQMLAYALAVKKTLCTPVKDVILFFLAADREWPVAVDDDAMNEAVRQIASHPDLRDHSELDA